MTCSIEMITSISLKLCEAEGSCLYRFKGSSRFPGTKSLKILFKNPYMLQIYLQYISSEDLHIGRLLWSLLYVCRYSLWIL